MAGRSHVTSEFSRDLSLFHLTMMGLGMMIGAGVFIGIGYSIHEAGPGGLLLTFALNGIIALCTVMAFAELSSAIPRAGGAYNFARIGFGRRTSFVVGWIGWFAPSVAGSLYAVTFATYTTNFLAQIGFLDGLPMSVTLVEKTLAVAIASLFIYINYRGASETGKVGALFTLGQMLFLAMIAVTGVITVLRDPSRLQNFQPFLPHGWSKVLVTMGFTYVAFEGFEVIAQAGDEAIDPKRNLPKAMLYSVFIVVLTYVVVSFATVVAVKQGAIRVEGEPWEWIGQFRERGFGEAVSLLMPTQFIGYLLVTFTVIFSSSSALNATIYSATRVSYALGRDRMLPASFAHISRKQKTPWVALCFTGGIVLTVATCLPTVDVASSASIMFLFLFLHVNVCAIKIRRNFGDELTYGFVMPFFPVLPLFAIACQAILAIWLVDMSWIAWVVALVWVLTGVAIYQFYGKSRATTADHEIVVLEEKGVGTDDKYRVMVALANPENALGLVRSTLKICETKNAKVELLHMVPVPDQVPLSDADRYLREGRKTILAAMRHLAQQYQVRTNLCYCRSIARGIVSAVREKRIDLLIVGWHGAPKGRSFTLGSTIDPIIELSPCNVVVLKDCGNKTFRRVLVPLAGGPNGGLALEVATMLVEKDGGEIVAFSVSSGRRPFSIDEFIGEHRTRLHVPREYVHTKVVTGSSVSEAIVEEGEGYDLVVLGCTREPLLSQFVRESIPELVAKRCSTPMVMVKASGGIQSWVKRWI